jgi:hypothetical protein
MVTTLLTRGRNTLPSYIGNLIMSQPTPYIIQTNFNEDEVNGAGGRSTVITTSLDIEFNNLKTTLDKVLTNLALLQRDDGKIADGSGLPHIFNLSSSLSGFLKFQSGAWSFVPDPTNPAQTAQALSETAQAASEAARDLALQYKDDAQAAKLAAETAQAAAELSQQSISSSENIQAGNFWYGTSSGAVNAYTLTLAPIPSSISVGLFIHMIAHAENTGPATLTVNSFAPKTIKKTDGSDLKAGDILSGAACYLFYDGTNFQFINPKVDQEQLEVVTSNLMLAFEEIQENHGGFLAMETGWSDSFGNANEQGADEANSTGEQHDNTNKLYKGRDPGTGLNLDKTYTTESNSLQQEWTNSLPSTGQATITNGDATVTLLSGSWPTNCEKGRISFDGGSTWYDIDTRTDATNIELATAATESNGNFNYIIRLSEIISGAAHLNEAGDGNTLLLLHGDGSDASTTITDSGNTGHSPVAGGNVQIDTAQSVFGGSSIYFDGVSGSKISIPYSSDWDVINVTSGDFTVDFRVKFNASPGTDVFFSFGPTGSDQILINYNTSNLQFSCNADSSAQVVMQETWSPSTGTWYHIALVKSGNDFMMFIDGTQLGSTFTDSDLAPTSPGGPLYIGGYSYTDASGRLNGWMDEIRISNIARWTSNFTLPTSAYKVGANPSNEYVSICDTFSQGAETSAWLDINSASVTESLNSQTIYYWASFDPVSSFGANTEIKIFNQTDSFWRVIAKKNGANWEYNNDSGNSATYTGVNATVNDMLHAVSQAISTQSGNRMTGTQLAEITDSEWVAANGWSTSIDKVIRGATFYSTSGSQKPLLDNFKINHDSERFAMDLRSKTYDPGFVPDEAYVWSRAEHSDVDGSGTFSVSRNGGSEWETISMVQQGLPFGNVRVLRGTVDLSGQTSGQDLRCRYQTTQSKEQFLHSWGLQAK